MARQRFIWPTIWTDPVLGRLKDIELLFYIGCFSVADDEGRLLGDPTYLRGTIFPYSYHGPRKMRSVRDNVLAAQDRLFLYTVNGIEYLAFSNWAKWQKPKYPSPSHYPSPPEDSGNGSGNVPEVIPPVPSEQGGSDSSTRAQGWVGLGRDGKREEAKASSVDFEDDPIDEQAIIRVYNTWRQTFDKTRSNYNTISPKRRATIKRWLKHFSPDDLCRAIEAVKLETPRWWLTHNDLDVILRSQERVEHFLELAESPPLPEPNGAGRRGGMSPADIVAYTKGRP